MARPDRAAAPLVSAIPLALIDAPLDYILADNIRQRGLCTTLREMADSGRMRRSVADDMIAFLETDMPLHHRDADEDLFPALRKRALPEDDLDAALASLSGDHRQSEEMARGIADALAARPADETLQLDAGIRETILSYAACEHRHLAIENSIVMAIARIRLTRGDLKSISASMKKRRGVLC